MRDGREFYKDIRLVRELMHAMFDLSGTPHTCVLGDERRWQPPADMYETERSLIIIIEVAGMRKEDFHIELREQKLTVTGKRGEYPIEGKTAYHSWEIDNGRFERTFCIPKNIDTEGIEAVYHYENGYLVIKLPRKRGSSRIIPVE
jgi:HSP20 family protein